MKIRILCEAHNNLLSDIDAEAGQLTRALRVFQDKPLIELREGVPAFELIHVDGKKFERWALKAFFNHALWSGCMSRDTPSWNITGDHILGYVFGKAGRPNNCGLFLYPSRGSFEEFKKKMFRLEVRTMKMHLWRHATGELTPEFNCPAFLRLTLYGCEIAVCGNIVGIGDDDWRNIMNGLEDHPKNSAQLYPRGWDFGRGDVAHGPESYTQLRLLFHWK